MGSNSGYGTAFKSLGSNLFTNSKTTTTVVIGLTAIGISLLLVTGGLRRYTVFITRPPRITSISQDENLAFAREINEQISSHPLVQQLRNDKGYEENRVYPWLREETRKYNLTAGTLLGKGRLSVPPVVFFSKEKMELLAFLHLGRDLCGHDGIVHGGLLSTIMDEMFARTVNPYFPHENGATAYLHVNFRTPCATNQIVKCQCKVTKLEGRKGFVEGKMMIFDKELLILDANALFLSVEKLEALKS
ncbi:hypothetical protein G9A89_021899 [Geosiphon pyriformis]|nr:hypothetical protein G9A89_021899 [Geosiphon pyriformis]